MLSNYSTIASTLYHGKMTHTKINLPKPASFSSIIVQYWNVLPSSMLATRNGTKERRLFQINQVINTSLHLSLYLSIWVCSFCILDSKSNRFQTKAKNTHKLNLAQKMCNTDVIHSLYRAVWQKNELKSAQARAQTKTHEK